MGSKAVNYPTKCGIARCFISQTLLKEHQRESASCSPGHNSAQCVSRDLFSSEKTKRLHATAQGASQTAAKFQSWSLVFVNPKRSPKRSKVTRKAANDVLSGRYPNLQLGRDERTNSSANTRTPLRYGKACNSADVYSWITFLVCAAFVDGLLTTQFVILLSFQSIPVNRLVKDFCMRCLCFGMFCKQAHIEYDSQMNGPLLLLPKQKRIAIARPFPSGKNLKPWCLRRLARSQIAAGQHDWLAGERERIGCLYRTYLGC
jgi:hypothetical protein